MQPLTVRAVRRLILPGTGGGRCPPDPAHVWHVSRPPQILDESPFGSPRVRTWQVSVPRPIVEVEGSTRHHPARRTELAAGRAPNIAATAG